MKKRQHETIALTEAELARFAGRYALPDAELTVSVKEGGLQIETTWIDWHTRERSPGSTERFEPIGPDQFVNVTTARRVATIDFLVDSRHGNLLLRKGGWMLPRRSEAEQS